MTPVSPVIAPEFAAKEVVYAKDQPEYNPLPAVRNERGVVMSRWRPTDEERRLIAEGGDVMLSVWTFGQPLQPLYMEVFQQGAPAVEIASRMGLLSE